MYVALRFLNTGLGKGDTSQSKEAREPDDGGEPTVSDEDARMVRPTQRSEGVGEDEEALVAPDGCLAREGHRGFNTGEGLAAGNGVDVRL